MVRPKDQWVIFILDTKLMNECLLVKWIWKISKGTDDMWYKLIKAKYMPEDNFFLSKTKGVSEFWQGLHKVKHLFHWGTIHIVRNGKGPCFRRTSSWKGAPID